jgi:hypothetical protein
MSTSFPPYITQIIFIHYTWDRPATQNILIILDVMARKKKNDNGERPGDKRIILHVKQHGTKLAVGAVTTQVDSSSTPSQQE